MYSDIIKLWQSLRWCRMAKRQPNIYCSDLKPCGKIIRQRIPGVDHLAR